MSKRFLASSPSSPRKRKAKSGRDQPNLDTFFQRRDSGVVIGPGKKDTNVREETLIEDQTGGRAGLGECSDSTSADEAFARRLAQEDGLDIEALRRLEERGWATRGDARVSASLEVIDVDLVDNVYTQSPGAGSSTSSGNVKRPSSDTPSPGKQKLADTRGGFGEAETQASPEYASLSVDPLEYTLAVAPWSEGRAAPYSFLAHTFCTLSGTKSRIAILNTLTNSLRTIIQYHPASLRPALYLLSNSLSPPYTPLELGLGPSIISKAIQDVSGLTPAALRRLYNTTGDPGTCQYAPAYVHACLIDEPRRGRCVRSKVQRANAFPAPALAYSGRLRRASEDCYRKGEWRR